MSGAAADWPLSRRRQIGLWWRGVVYRAYDEKLQRDVAIKLLNRGAEIQDANASCTRRETRRP